MTTIATEFITCPRGKCPLDVLADMGKETVGAWIYLSDKAVAKLAKSADDDYTDDGFREMVWNGTEKYPPTLLRLDDNRHLKWNLVHKIDAEDIAFKEIPSIPAKIFFVKLEAKKKKE